VQTSRFHRVKRLYGHEKIKFLVVGGFNTVFGFAVFSILQLALGAQITYFGSLYGAHIVSSTVAFILYRTYVFPVSGPWLRDYYRFQLIYVVPLLVNTFLLPFFVHLVHLDVFVAQAVTTVLLAVASFFGHKYFSFRRSGNEGPN
jgi:putative flippase GtrA